LIDWFINSIIGRFSHQWCTDVQCNLNRTPFDRLIFFMLTCSHFFFFSLCVNFCFLLSFIHSLSHSLTLEHINMSTSIQLGCSSLGDWTYKTCNWLISASSLLISRLCKCLTLSYYHFPPPDSRLSVGRFGSRETHLRLFRHVYFM